MNVLASQTFSDTRSFETNKEHQGEGAQGSSPHDNQELRERTFVQQSTTRVIATRWPAGSEVCSQQKVNKMLYYPRVKSFTYRKQSWKSETSIKQHTRNNEPRPSSTTEARVALHRGNRTSKRQITTLTPEHFVSSTGTC